MKNTVLLTTLAISIVAGSALSAGNEHKHGRHGPHLNFDAVDTNNDGKLTKEEMTAHMDARFDEADTDNDGLVSVDELRAQMKKRMEAKLDKRVAHVMDRHDENEDGLLNRDEMKPNRMGHMLKHADEDGDGTISREEFESMKDRRGKWHGKKKDG